MSNILSCCNECSYCKNDYCSVLSADVKRIENTPCKIPLYLLNDAEIFMRDNHRKVFILYILNRIGWTLKEGELLSVLTGLCFRHSNDTHSSYLTVVADMGNGVFECVDPDYNAPMEDFAMYLRNGGTILTLEDFDDASNDYWGVSSDDIGTELFPIGKMPELDLYIDNRMKEDNR